MLWFCNFCCWYSTLEHHVKQIVRSLPQLCIFCRRIRFCLMLLLGPRVPCLCSHGAVPDQLVSRSHFFFFPLSFFFLSFFPWPAAPGHGHRSRDNSVTTLLAWLLGTGAGTWLWYMAARAASSGLVPGVASCLRWPPLPGTAAVASSRLSLGIGRPTIPWGTASVLGLPLLQKTGTSSAFLQLGIPGGPRRHLSGRALGAASSTLGRTNSAATASSGLARGI